MSTRLLAGPAHARRAFGALRQFGGVLVAASAIVAAGAGAGCRRRDDAAAREGLTTQALGSAAGSDRAAQAPTLHLTKTALLADEDAIPLPLSEEFLEEIPSVDGALSRAAARAGGTVRVRVERDVPYGQLTRLLQRGVRHRIPRYMLYSQASHTSHASRESQGSEGAQGEDGRILSLVVPPPGPTPRGECWSRLWIGPDARVQMSSPGGGVLVRGRDRTADLPAVFDVLRRYDVKCSDGVARLYSQPGAPWGPVFDLARAIVAAVPAIHLARVELQVPSRGPLDSPDELHK